MNNFQQYFATIVCVVGGLATIIAFFQTIKPYFKRFSQFQQSPLKLEKELGTVESALIDIKDSLKSQDEKDEKILVEIDKLSSIEMTLLHDSILSIYCTAIKENKLEESDYRRACELYALDGESEYIEQIMECLKSFHEKQIRQENLDIYERS